MSSDGIDEATAILAQQDEPYLIVVAGISRGGNTGTFSRHSYDYYSPGTSAADKLWNAKALIHALDLLIADIKEQNDIKEWE